MVTLGVLTLGFGIAALIAETSWALLVPMVAGLVIIWAAPCCMTPATSRPHTRSGTPDRRSAAGPACRALPGGSGPAAGHSQPDPVPGDCWTPGLLFRAGPGSS
jgi:hypothetical protein